MGEKFKNPHN